MQSNGTINFAFDDGHGYGFPVASLRSFRAQRFDASLSARVSLQFCVTLIAYDLRYGLGESILRAVNELETGRSMAGTKPATPFKRPPLLGLWHKHFTDARFLADNYLLAARNAERVQMLEELVPELEGLSAKDVAERIVQKVYVEPVEQRFASQRATGEWIVFLPRAGRNYYLTCSTHRRGRESQQSMRDEIISICSLDFPHLREWLADPQETKTTS